MADRSERMKLNYALSARDRRRMFKQLSDAQEAVEAAMEARDKLMAETWSKGLPIVAITGATGLGHNTAQRVLRDQGVESVFDSE